MDQCHVPRLLEPLTPLTPELNTSIVVFTVYKKCTRCSEVKPVDAYFKDKQKSNGFSPHCKTCDKRQSREWALKNKEQRKNNISRSLYKLKKDANYEKMAELQSYCCEMCGIHASNFKKRLNIDHNHKTGQIRGLLCVTCNLGLGAFKESPELLYAAIVYLEKYKWLSR